MSALASRAVLCGPCGACVGPNSTRAPQRRYSRPSKELLFTRVAGAPFTKRRGALWYCSERRACAVLSISVGACGCTYARRRLRGVSFFMPPQIARARAQGRTPLACVARPPARAHGRVCRFLSFLTSRFNEVRTLVEEQGSGGRTDADARARKRRAIEHPRRILAPACPLLTRADSDGRRRRPWRTPSPQPNLEHRYTRAPQGNPKTTHLLIHVRVHDAPRGRVVRAPVGLGSNIVEDIARFA